jgi:pyruvate dehydrogenase E2 component (dihydrolipoamide acetyltransferase)
VQRGVPVAPSEPPPGGGGGPERELVSLTRSQAMVARRMAEAKSTIPDFQTTVEIDMEGCVGLREALRELSQDEPVPSYNDMIIRTSGLALREHPQVNSS